MRLSEFTDEFGIRKFDVENWLKRETMRTEYAPTTPPIPRDFTRANVVELAVTAALVAAGARPSTGIAVAALIVSEYRTLHRITKRWLVAPAGDFEHGLRMDTLDPARIAEIAATSPHGAAVMIDAKSIVDRVDALFDRAKAER